MSYASQEPWVFTGSVRQNILFGKAFVEARYWKTLEVCGLEHDLALWEHADHTMVGEKGVMLSGNYRGR